MEQVDLHRPGQEQEHHDEQINLLQEELDHHLVDLGFLLLLGGGVCVLLLVHLVSEVEEVQSEGEGRVEELDEEEGQVEDGHVKVKDAESDQVLVLDQLVGEEAGDVEGVGDQEDDEEHWQVDHSGEREELVFVLENKGVGQPDQDADGLKGVVAGHLEEPDESVHEEMCVGVLEQEPGVMQELVEGGLFLLCVVMDVVKFLV